MVGIKSFLLHEVWICLYSQITIHIYLFNWQRHGKKQLLEPSEVNFGLHNKYLTNRILHISFILYLFLLDRSNVNKK